MASTQSGSLNQNMKDTQTGVHLSTSSQTILSDDFKKYLMDMLFIPVALFKYHDHFRLARWLAIVFSWKLHAFFFDISLLQATESNVMSFNRPSVFNQSC